MLLLVACTLLVASVGSLLLIRRASASTAEQELYSQARYIATLQHGVGFGSLSQRNLNLIKHLGDYRTLSVAALGTDGTFTRGIPPALADMDLRTDALSNNQSVAGTTGDVVYVLIPLELTATQKDALRRPVSNTQQAVLVATRTVRPPVSGLQWFLVIGLASLAVAAVVAYLLANRFARPLETAASATKHIAGGDLETRIPVSPRDMPEFASLATAINAMGDGLERGRDQQRHFLLSVSHDLRTPLTSIQGYADALADGTTHDVAGATAIIATEARRLERLVQDLLDLARLDARRFSFHYTYVDVGDVVHRATERFGPEATNASLTLTTSVPDTTVWVLTDGDRLLQVLSNLVENAFRYAGSHIALGARMHSGQAIVWVDDDGAGISPQDLPHVFEPDFTSDRSGARVSGSGLGLAIVAELAAVMGGGVRAESPVTPQGGTRMVLWLPTATPSPIIGPTTPSPPAA